MMSGRVAAAVTSAAAPWGPVPPPTEGGGVRATIREDRAGNPLVRAAVTADNLEIALRVSAGLSSVARQALRAEPARVLAKGGITSQDVAVRGLGMQRAEVVGQFFPGLVSMLRPLSASPAAAGRPNVIFAGNVGDDNALADVARRLRGLKS